MSTIHEKNVAFRTKVNTKVLSMALRPASKPRRYVVGDAVEIAVGKRSTLTTAESHPKEKPGIVAPEAYGEYEAVCPTCSKEFLMLSEMGEPKPEYMTCQTCYKKEHGSFPGDHVQLTNAQLKKYAVGL